MMTRRLLREHLREYEGDAMSIPDDIRAELADEPEYLDDLVALFTDERPGIAEGATWLFKAEVEAGAQVPPHLVGRIAASLDHLTSWQARLHICQSIEAFSCTDDQADRLFDWAAALADHERPFLRAWSLHARVVLARRFARHRPWADRALAAADSDTAASVRARARRLRKTLGAGG